MILCFVTFSNDCFGLHFKTFLLAGRAQQEPRAGVATSQPAGNDQRGCVMLPEQLQLNEELQEVRDVLSLHEVLHQTEVGSLRSFNPGSLTEDSY